MSLVTKNERPMHFDSSYGNWVPAEIINAFECNYCQSVADSAYTITWKEDYHICPDCVDDFLQDAENDALLETDFNTCECPVCDELMRTKQFKEHLFEHMNMEDAQ